MIQYTDKRCSNKIMKNEAIKWYRMTHKIVKEWSNKIIKNDPIKGERNTPKIMKNDPMQMAHFESNYSWY